MSIARRPWIRTTAAVALMSLAAAVLLTLAANGDLAYGEQRPDRKQQQLEASILSTLKLLPDVKTNPYDNVASSPQARVDLIESREAVNALHKSADAEQRARIVAELVRDRPSMDLALVFRAGSADIDVNAAPVLNALGEALRSNDSVILLTTPADAGASEGFALADRRALAARDYLIARFNFRPERILALGHNAENQQMRVVNLLTQ